MRRATCAARSSIKKDRQDWVGAFRPLSIQIRIIYADIETTHLNICDDYTSWLEVGLRRPSRTLYE